MTYVRLGDAAQFINGVAFKPADWCDQGLPIIRIQNLTGTGQSFNRTDRKVRQELLIEPGDLLVSWSATLGVYRWSGPRGVLNQHIFKVVPRDEVDKNYLYYAVNEVVNELERKTHGSTMRHVVRGDFEGTMIRLPPLPEQKRIANLLLRAENIVRMRREAEVKAREIIPALFLDMFGDPVANSRAWPVCALGELVASIDSGKSPRAHDRCRAIDEWGVLKLGAVTWGAYDESQHKTLPPDVAPFAAAEVRSGDVLISRKNTSELVGASAYVWETSGRMLLPDLIFRLALPSPARVDPLYLWGLLSSGSKRWQLRRLATGAAASMPNISKARLGKLAVELPPIERQREFGQRVTDMHEILHDFRAARKVAESVYTALISRVFEPRRS